MDGHAAAQPDPGRATIRRLKRVEYANAVSDLLALPVNFSRELPPDNSGYGFDNIADVLTVSPTARLRLTKASRRCAIRSMVPLPTDPPRTLMLDVAVDGHRAAHGQAAAMAALVAAGANPQFVADNGANVVTGPPGAAARRRWHWR